MELCLKIFENAIIDRYNIICSITAHDRQQPTYVYGASSDVGRSIRNNGTTATLKLLGATFNFIHCWLKHF